LNTREMAQDYLKKARRCLKESTLAFNEKDYSISAEATMLLVTDAGRMFLLVQT